MNINGTLVTNFGQGNIILDNVKVNGVTVSNVGSHSLHIKGNSSIGLLTINDTNNDAHIVVEDNASVTNTAVYSGAKLEVASGAKNTKPFSNVTIAPTSNDEVVLSGTFDNINITNPAKVTLDDNTKINNQIKIATAAELNVSSKASVAKVDISTSEANDKVTLNGNLNNVNVSSAASIEVKSGTVQIASSTNADVKVTVDDSAKLTTGKGSDNITTSGNGTVVKKDNLSDEAEVKVITFEDSYLDYYGKQIWNIPAAIKVQDLINSVLVSDFATAKVVDEQGNLVSNDAYITESMKLRVLSESEKVKNDYSINLQWASGNTYELQGFQYDSSMWQNPFGIDTNAEKGKFSGTIIFNKPANETDVDGYYLSIAGQKLQENSNGSSLSKYMNQQIIYQVFVPKSSVIQDKYSVKLENIDLKGYTQICCNVIPAINNKKISASYLTIYDNPVDIVKPSTEGISIADFTDTNNDKGKIEGTITFTKASDESHISYYNVMIEKQYNNSPGSSSSSANQIGYLEPGDDKDGIYTISTGYPVSVGNADDIRIVIIPVNKDGLQPDYDKRITKSIVDNPIDQEVKVGVPKLFADLSEDYRLNVTGCTEGSMLKLYKYDKTQDNFVPYIKNGQPVTITAWGENSEFDKVDVGIYKATQTSEGKETDMSNEAVIKPMKLSGVLQDSSLSLINAIDGATIKVYDEDGNVIKTITKVQGQVPVVDGLTNGVYYVTQTIDEIESSKFIVPVEQDYTIDDIVDSVVNSLNKANINVKRDGDNIIISKKNEGSIGSITIDTGADLSISVYGDLTYDKIYQKLGSWNFSHAKSLTVNINSSFDTLKSQANQVTVGVKYNNTQYEFKVTLE